MNPRDHILLNAPRHATIIAKNKDDTWQVHSQSLDDMMAMFIDYIGNVDEFIGCIGCGDMSFMMHYYDQRIFISHVENNVSKCDIVTLAIYDALPEFWRQLIDHRIDTVNPSFL